MILFILGLIFLLYFSYRDIRTKQISNKSTIVFIIVSIATILICFNLTIIILMLFTFGLLYFLWKLKAIGGADVKIIPFLLPFILIGSSNIIVAYWFFLIMFGIIGGLYGVTFKLLSKKSIKYIPFFPAITLTYILLRGFMLLSHGYN